MPEELLENLDSEELKGIKEEDIMWPEPSPEQVSLWQEIDRTINQTVLDRDNLFNSLPKSLKTLLASEETSIKLMKIGQKYGLAPDQVIALSRYIKSLFIEFRTEDELNIPKLINLLCSNLDITTDKGQVIFQEINNEILLPALKDILVFGTESENLPSSAGSNNVVDLKNKKAGE